MSITKIRKHNSQQFLDDIKRVSEVGTFPKVTDGYFKLGKANVKKEAEESTIYYYITRKIYRVGREVMIIR